MGYIEVAPVPYALVPGHRGTPGGTARHRQEDTDDTEEEQCIRQKDTDDTEEEQCIAPAPDVIVVIVVVVIIVDIVGIVASRHP